ncbi:leucine-rich repeat protein soc-2-like isoform X2 [Thrips palmi]|uniref:Leucine-rich repeat protein soc-2-like isoform X2 n=1 Tax=Thrips palmi TaxID=161013 RepID=A0A6P8ZWB3_THRPL|nr:leucine-rich repeat protein soc-2-like isoform X2 [Thrips palmi]
MAEPLDQENVCQNTNHVYAINSGVLSFHLALLPKLRTLTHMDLSNCKISTLPEALSDLVALQCLQASNNLLTCLPSSIGQLKSLSRLVLPQNLLTTLPDSFAELRSLEFLNLSHNQLQAVPTCFQEGVVRISYLDVSHNHIEDWSLAPMCGHALKVLNCSNNCLKANPAWLWSDFCHSLEELDLSFNLFSNASQVVKTYNLWRTGVTVRLKNLRLYQCGLSTPHINLLHQLKVLERLDIGNTKDDKTVDIKRNKRSLNNFIWEISFKPFQCTGVLTELILCGLGLSTLPDDINCLEVLEILNCDGNRLQWLPDTFCELSKLRVAVLSNNSLLYLPDEFGNLSNLVELLLDSNQIGELPSSCSKLHSLKWLDLYKNNLEALPSFLEEGLGNLSGVDLELNYFNPKSSLNYSSKLYTSLKDAMHIKVQVGAKNGLIRRSGLQKPDTHSDYSSDSPDRLWLSDNESTVSDNDTEDLVESSYNSLKESTFSTDVSRDDDEDWDLDEGQDDYFDPTVKQTRTHLTMPARALIIHEVVLHSGSFLPSDIHPSPSIRADKNPFVPDDGQFEDA